MNTYKEAVRNKVFYIILVFAMLLLAFSLVLASLALGEDDRIIKHIGLSAINVFGLLLATFVGVNLVYEELDKRTIYTIISSGVTRTQFIIGKYLGLFYTLLVNVIIMGMLLSALIYFWPNSSFTLALVLAMYSFLFEMMIITAIAVLFSSFSTPVLSAVLTLICYVIGHLSEDLLDWSKRLQEQGSIAVSKLLWYLYYILPNLDIFNLKNKVVYQEDIGSLSNVLFVYPSYAILYSSLLLMIAIFSFTRRDFK
jgi:Cu-processing system permease protein